jgi:outer membrane protein assembly factor BamB
MRRRHMINQVSLSINNGISWGFAPQAGSRAESAEDIFIPSQAGAFSQKKMIASTSSTSAGISLDKAAESLLKKPEPSPEPYKQLWGISSGDLEGCSSKCLGPDGTIHFKTAAGALISLKDGKMIAGIMVNRGCDPSVACGADGTVYTGVVKLVDLEPRGEIIALKDGKKLWEFQTGDAVRHPAIVGADGTIYAGDDSGNLYALKYESKLGGLLKGVTKKWSCRMGGGLCADMNAGSDGTIYMPTGPKTIYDEEGSRLHAIKNGKELWNVKLDSEIYTRPGIGPDGTIYVRCKDEKLYAIKDGKKLWDYKTDFSVEHDVCVGHDGTIYYGDGGQKLVAVKDGKKLWDFKTDDWGYFKANPCIGKDGTVYAGSRSGILYAIRDGKREWAVRMQNGIDSLIMDEKNSILNVVTDKGEVHALKISGIQKNDPHQISQEVMNGSDEGKAAKEEPKIDESSADGWVIIGGVKLPKKH